MRAAVRVLGLTLARAWPNLPRLIVTNVGWLVLSWPLVTLGCTTLALYSWLRRAIVVREQFGSHVQPEEPLVSVLADVREHWQRGVVWMVLNVVFAFVLFANVVFWRSRMAPLGEAVLMVGAAYVVWFVLALQPYWLDGMASGRGVLRALRASVRSVAMHPLFAHACAVPPLVLVVAGFVVQSFWPLVGVSVLLLYWGHVAAAEPRTRRRVRVEELL